MLHLVLTIIALFALLTPTLSAQQPSDPVQALAHAHELAEHRDFQGVFDTLQPYLSDTLDSEVEWEIAAEFGRAAYHCAHYQQALAILRKVVAARPVILEPALYLGATSYILGDRAQALTVLEAVLQSGTVDLYRAVTLPGEKTFLADPEVREILERHSRPLVVDVQRGTAMGLPLGLPRNEVIERLGADSAGTGSIAARAGPSLIWVWSFGEDDTLSEVVLDTENLWRYTPYRVRIGADLSWNATPADALAALGPPRRTLPGEDETLVMGWDRDAARLDLVFHRSNEDPESPGRLEIVRLYAPPHERIAAE